jgi:F0F1-type ATP synthase assembly protein I
MLLLLVLVGAQIGLVEDTMVDTAPMKPGL